MDRTVNHTISVSPRSDGGCTDGDYPEDGVDVEVSLTAPPPQAAARAWYPAAPPPSHQHQHQHHRHHHPPPPPPPSLPGNAAVASTRTYRAPPPEAGSIAAATNYGAYGGGGPPPGVRTTTTTRTYHVSPGGNTFGPPTGENPMASTVTARTYAGGGPGGGDHFVPPANATVTTRTYTVPAGVAPPPPKPPPVVVSSALAPPPDAMVVTRTYTIPAHQYGAAQSGAAAVPPEAINAAATHPPNHGGGGGVTVSSGPPLTLLTEQQQQSEYVGALVTPPEAKVTIQKYTIPAGGNAANLHPGPSGDVDVPMAAPSPAAIETDANESPARGTTSASKFAPGTRQPSPDVPDKGAVRKTTKRADTLATASGTISHDDGTSRLPIDGTAASDAPHLRPQHNLSSAPPAPTLDQLEYDMRNDRTAAATAPLRGISHSGEAEGEPTKSAVGGWIGGWTAAAAAAAQVPSGEAHGHDGAPSSAASATAAASAAPNQTHEGKFYAPPVTAGAPFRPAAPALAPAPGTMTDGSNETSAAGNHCVPPYKPAPGSAPQSEAANKPKANRLPFAEMHASDRARLTMYPPNRLAHSLFLDTRKRVNAGLTKGQRAQKVCWVSIASIIGGFGVLACVTLLAKGDAETQAVIPFMFFLFVLMPGILATAWIFEKWQHLAPDKVLECVGDVLDGRARDAMMSVSVGGGGMLLAAYEPRVGDERGTLVVDLFPDGLGPFRALQRGGYASIPSWATYHAAWKALLSRLDSEGEHDGLAVVVEMHTKWLELLSKMAVAADGLTFGLDQQRIKAYKRMARQGLDFAGDTLSDLADIGGMFGDLKDMKESLEKIAEAVKDTREAYKAYGIDADWEDDRPEGGLHPIQQRKLAFMIPFICLCFFLPALSFGLLGVPAGAWAMVGVGVLMVVATSWFSTRINASMQLLECIVNLEVKQRAILARLIEANTRGVADVRQLVAATDKLRDVLMENYYDALAIHMQSEALTFRPFPYPGNPPMLVPRAEGDKGALGAADPSGEQEIEVVLPAGSGEPEVVVENITPAEENTSLGESGIPVVTAMDTPQIDNPTIPVQAHRAEEEPIQEGKTVEMTIKPDGTKTIKTTTTIRNPDGTTSTTITTSTANADSASEAPEDYFHDEETGVVHL